MVFHFKGLLLCFWPGNIFLNPGKCTAGNVCPSCSFSRPYVPLCSMGSSKFMRNSARSFCQFALPLALPAQKSQIVSQHTVFYAISTWCTGLWYHCARYLNIMAGDYWSHCHPLRMLSNRCHSFSLSCWYVFLGIFLEFIYLEVFSWKWPILFDLITYLLLIKKQNPGSRCEPNI